MAILTRYEFAGITQAKAGYKSKQTFINESRQYSRINYTTSIFLSHSHTDKDVVEQAVVFFRTLGINVYVDWMDETMPERPNGETALLIKQKIQENDKFVLLGTNAAIASKWCNWEVGIADTFKQPRKKLVILPLADNSRNWDGNEYLQVYGRIEKQSTSFGEDFFIYYPDGTVETLFTWVKR